VGASTCGCVRMTNVRRTYRYPFPAFPHASSQHPKFCMPAAHSTKHDGPPREPPNDDDEQPWLAGKAKLVVIVLNVKWLIAITHTPTPLYVYSPCQHKPPQKKRRTVFKYQ
jgi:hypothetical protein